MYRETSPLYELGGFFSDISERYNRQFEATWMVANSKGHATTKSNTPKYIRYFVAKIYSDHGYVVIMFFQNAKDKNAEMKRLNAKNDKGTLDPNITEYASVKFTNPLKKTGDRWYIKTTEPIPSSAIPSRPGTIPDRFMPFIASRYLNTLKNT